MNFFLRTFVIGILLYHILITIFGYGIFSGSNPQLPSIIRDGIRILGIVGFAGRNIRFLGKILREYRKLFALCFVLVIWSVIRSYALHRTAGEMMIGIKYDYRYLFIMLGGLVLGSLWKEKTYASASRFSTFLDWCAKIFVWVVAFGFLRQAAKLVLPNLFFSIGYGPLNDFHFGANPPLYYLTGFGGTLRRQGIFAGPNNYGYFLVAFFPLILSRIQKGSKTRKILSLSVWILALLMTLSRSAYIGAGIVVIWWYRAWISKHRKRALGAILLGLGAVGYLTFLKGTSSLAHISAKLNGFILAGAHPFGLGLGTSGPAIHHSGTILPENYFIQIILEAGFPALIVWLGVWRYALRLSKKTVHGPVFMIGISALLAMGLFLHVFEDSMVNYPFFFLRGISLGIGYGIPSKKEERTREIV